MTVDFTAETFQPHRNDAFEVMVRDSSGIGMELVEVNRLPACADAPRKEPFSILFLGPKSPILPQKIYRMKHPQMGEFEIFIVPVGPDRAGFMQYEAVFN